METHQCVCDWRGDGLDVYISTQYIWGVRDEVAEAFGLPADKVRVVCEYMGGGFGAKASAGGYTLIAAELARRTGRPVRYAMNRREENMVAGNRNATIQRVTAGARSDGTLTVLGGEYFCALGWSGWLPSTAGPMQMLHACENVRTVEYGAKLNLPPMAAFRAPGFVEGTWSLECLLDKVAAELDIDPLELRRLNYANADTLDGRPYSGKNLMECYRRAEPYWERRDRRARTLRRHVEARCRAREPDLVRRRRTSVLRVGARRLGRSRERGHRDAGHRHGHAHGDGADRRRGARAPARPRRGAGRRLRARAVRRHLRRLVDAAVDGPRRSRGRGGRRAADPRDRGPALRGRAARALARAAATSSRPTAARGRSRRSRGCSRTARSSARARAARTPRACAC